MPNAGFPEVRDCIADRLRVRTGIPYTADDILMSNGAAGALNTVLKAILDPGDEVIVLRPSFPEYRFYVENHGGRVVEVETDSRFQPDPERIARAITPRTKALILNSPNNPTGVVYGADILGELNRVVREPVLVLSDEPYRPIVFDGIEPPETPRLIERCVMAWSWSKAMAISGERIGYLAIPPHLAEAAALRNACTFATRILGYINAPAIWQWVVAEARDATVDVAAYQAKRDRAVRLPERGGVRCAAAARLVLRVPENADRRRCGIHRAAAGTGDSGGAGTGLRPRRVHAALADHRPRQPGAVAAGVCAGDGGD